ncbi:hypothetical protein A2362_02625 [Candidatus Curtissbacteria bacterium RIFOXYB1_FULL_41_59]|nr:MAG: hypothetical protein UT95_C0034G0011 [Candidatus Curtissbacteria bacterium GW2011_GWB1_40_28]KKR60721.1 MAG: hypothetical protein UU00_C0028G0014 [Microgenomates group bacterium GW2011_GWC1_40_35]OGD79529.1 MAG: hypothetical protein A2683_00940 [Candidatus Curtissbacteria bacterium RIFCSPHIGHO2_01_FULL_34_40]OGE05322.1 MAG: hypothetical protein A2362_02625 [Candidatus Curtissbacteria bacterium RIFOXYB1_FULL_41_59]OGE08057.1 MAG: hypothetical protein A2615_00600 [Candidatus Curtissbacter
MTPDRQHETRYNWDWLSDHARSALMFAKGAAEATGSDRVEPQHLFFGLDRETHGIAASILERNGLTTKIDGMNLEGANSLEVNESDLDDVTGIIIQEAFKESARLGDSVAGTTELLLGYLAYIQAEARYQLTHEIDLYGPFAKILQAQSLGGKA